MTHKHNILHSLLLLLSAQVLALSTDNQQPIHIVSEQQSLDMINNIVTFTGQVVLKRGSINIQAEKILISRPNKKNNIEVVEGYGNPITFYQLQDDGKPLHGHSLQIRYETEKDLLILTGDAYLEQLDSSVKGDCITYLIKKIHASTK